MLFSVFAEAALGKVLRYSIHELVPEKRAMEEELHRELTADEARLYALRRMEIFFRYVDVIYAKEERPFAQVLSEDGQKLSKLKEADLLVGDEN